MWQCSMWLNIVQSTGWVMWLLSGAALTLYRLNTTIEIEHVGSFSKVSGRWCGDGEQPLPLKSSALARFRRSERWWWRKTTATIEIERIGSFSKVVEALEGGGDGEQPPPSKSSNSFSWVVEGGGLVVHQFRQQWKVAVVVMNNNHHPRNRAHMLVFEGGGSWWSWKPTTANEIEPTCSISRVVEGGGAGPCSHWPKQRMRRGRNLSPLCAVLIKMEDDEGRVLPPLLLL